MASPDLPPTVTSPAEAHAERAARLDAVVEESDAALASMQETIRQAQEEARHRKGSPPSEQLRLAAVHEAGHVVLALAAGADLTGAAVFDSGRGFTWTAGGTGTDGFCLAGAAAERFEGNGHARPSPADLALLSGDVRERTLAGWQAEEILDANWSKVQAVAARLVERGFVDAALARAIVGRVSVPGRRESDG